MPGTFLGRKNLKQYYVDLWEDIPGATIELVRNLVDRNSLYLNLCPSTRLLRTKAWSLPTSSLEGQPWVSKTMEDLTGMKL
jgi:hypothetical protein